MPSLSNEVKNSKSLTLEEAQNDLTWDEADYTWDEATGTWNVPGSHLTKESKNSKSLTNESENV